MNHSPEIIRMQPSSKRPKFLQQPMSNCYNGYMVNKNINSPTLVCNAKRNNSIITII